MPRVAELLDRESETVDLEDGDFERLLLRRERKQRNRRLRAGVLAFVVVLSTAAILLRSFAAGPVPVDRSTPTPPMALGALAYFLDGDLYVADWNGANPTRVVNGDPETTEGCPGEYWAEGTIWSPDGRYLAARHTTRCQEGQSMWWDAVIIDPEGEVVATIPSEGWLVSWSPDSTRVAVWITWGETIGVYGLDGERQAVLELPPGWELGGDYDPVWSRDGASLLLPHGLVIPLDGSTPRQLPSDDPRSSNYVAYSPDGSRVAYVDYIHDNGSLVVATADGSNAQEMSAPRVEHPGPVWSPTGDRIGFIYSEKAGQASELRVLDVAAGEVTSLTGGSEVILNIIGFSPEGDRILYSRTENMGRGNYLRQSSLWSINADGSDPRRLVSGTTSGDWQSLSSAR
jgi:Tol biopolymer transport system component